MKTKIDTQKKGVFIVLDGADGSGKTTQANLLINALKQKNIAVKYMDFPQYYSSFHGNTVAKFLRGEFGSIDQVSPYLASLTYALDRMSAKKEMENFLNSGGYIVANRYATSNMAHQGAKFKTKKDTEEFLKWVNQLEYEELKIPKEDLVIFLEVPWQISTQLTQTRERKKYLNGKTKDIHEADTEHIKKAEEMYQYLVKKNKHWVKIDCIEDGKILGIEIIHKKVIDILHKKNII